MNNFLKSVLYFLYTVFQISPNLQALDILGDPNDHVEEVNYIDLNSDNLIVHKRVMDQLNNNDDIGSIADTLKYSSGDIDLIEMNTRGQSNNDLLFGCLQCEKVLLLHQILRKF